MGYEGLDYVAEQAYKDYEASYGVPASKDELQDGLRRFLDVGKTEGGAARHPSDRQVEYASSHIIDVRGTDMPFVTAGMSDRAYEATMAAKFREDQVRYGSERAEERFTAHEAQLRTRFHIRQGVRIMPFWGDSGSGIRLASDTWKKELSLAQYSQRQTALKMANERKRQLKIMDEQTGSALL